MARGGGSFSFAKRQKELKRQKKKQEKLERRQAAKDETPGLDGSTADGQQADAAAAPLPPVENGSAPPSADEGPGPN